MNFQSRPPIQKGVFLPETCLQQCPPQGRESGDMKQTSLLQKLLLGRGQSSWITGRCRWRVLRTLLGQQLVGKAAAWSCCPEAQEPRCQSLDGLSRECPCTLASHSLVLRTPWAFLLSVCLRRPQGSAEEPVLDVSLQLGFFSWDFPKSQSRGSAVPASGSVGCWVLEWVVISYGDLVGELSSEAQAGQWGLLSRSLAAGLSSTEVGCTS